MWVGVLLKCECVNGARSVECVRMRNRDGESYSKIKKSLRRRERERERERGRERGRGLVLKDRESACVCESACV